MLGMASDESYLDEELGNIELARLEKDELMTDAAIINNKDAFWSNKMQQQAKVRVSMPSPI